MLALVTGGSRGVGYYLAKELRRRGYHVILIAKNEERVLRAAKELEAEGYAIDLSRDFKEVGKIIEKRKPKVVINNAGFGLYGEFVTQDEDRLLEMIDLNVKALTYLTKKAMEKMKEGYIMNVASVAACKPLARAAVYAATKAYVEHLTRSLIQEAPPGIHLSYLLLGPTDTDFWRVANWPVGKLRKLMLSLQKVARKALAHMLRGHRRIVIGNIYRLYCLGK